MTKQSKGSILHKLRYYLILNLVLLIANFCSKIFFQPQAVVIPHHNFVKEIRLNYLQIIAKQRIKTNRIIIVGPDHFSQNQRTISFADHNWQLANGNLMFDQKVKSEFLKIATLSNPTVVGDHSIYNVLTDIQQVWPNSKVIPVLIGQQFPLSQLNNLINTLEQNCLVDCLLIASVDFSHYLPATLADVHDRMSLRVLNNLEKDNITNLEIDSPQAIYSVINFALNRKTLKWQLFAHTNTGFLAQDPSIETTTHIFGSYRKSIVPPKKDTSFTFIYTRNKYDPQKNLTTVGQRFFYGTDIIDVGRSPPFNLVIPTNNIIAGYSEKQKSLIYFLPVSTNNEQLNFIKGTDRNKNLSDIINLLPNYRSNIFWGFVVINNGVNINYEK